MSSKAGFITERRDEAEAEMRKIMDKADTHKRSMSVTEKTDYESWEATRNLAETELIKMEAEERTKAERFAKFGSLAPLGASTSERGGTYQQNGQHSYFKDLLESRNGDSGARERLDRHGREFNDNINSRGLREVRAISTTAGSGGEFAPPLWLIDDYIAALRPARATADVLTKLELPAGTDVLNIPKVNTGTTTAVQTTQNTGISQTDITTSSVPATVYTIAGGQTFSNQLFEQSPMAGTMDRVILGDLIADYAKQVGSLVLNGTGTAQPLGLLAAAGTTLTYTDATPAFMGPGKLYAQIGKAVQTVQTARFLAPSHIVMHPRRWAWCAVQVDTAGRAVILPGAGGPLNASGLSSNGAAQGVVGEMFGLPVITDPNVPTNLGAGTNQDPIIVVKADDSWLYESSIRAEVFPQTYANQLSMFARVYNYVALAHRTPQSICVINGTGLIAPTF